MGRQPWPNSAAGVAASGLDAKHGGAERLHMRRAGKNHVETALAAKLPIGAIRNRWRAIGRSVSDGEEDTGSPTRVRRPKILARSDTAGTEYAPRRGSRTHRTASCTRAFCSSLPTPCAALAHDQEFIRRTSSVQVVVDRLAITGKA